MSAAHSNALAASAPSTENGADVTTGERGGGSGRILADAGQGRAAGFDAAGDGSTPSVAQAQSTDTQTASTASALTRASDALPASVASDPALTTSVGTSAQSTTGIGASAQAVTLLAATGGGTSAGEGNGTSTDAPPLLAAGVPMQDMIDAIHATVAIAARQGIAQARIELQPEELGQISIRLSQTSAGLSARVSADTAAGAQALTQAGSELRQSLSSLGVSLLRLDIGSFGQSHAREQDERFSGQSEGSSASTVTTTTTQDSETVGELDGATRPAGAARGEIVDVLA